ncbi:MAG: hypothetical protein WD407_10805 [Rhodospirillales bacterium]
MVQMVCLVMLLGNLVGGLLSSTLHAFEKPAPPRKTHQKPSVRLFVIGEIIFVVFAVYFHGMVKPHITNWELGYWIATFLMAPLFAIVGSQISKIALAEKLAANRKSWAKIEAKQKAKKAEEAKKAAERAKDEKTMNDDIANLTKLEEEEIESFDDEMNITNIRE